jgi:preprotein translocase subunit SecG
MRPGRLVGAGYLGMGTYTPAAMVTTIVAVLQLLTSLGMIFLILLHSGRGGGVSDMFGGGMGGSQGGSTTMERNLDRLTVAVAIMFGVLTITLTLLLA